MEYFYLSQILVEWKRENSDPTARVIWQSPETVLLVTTGEGGPLASSGLMPGMLTSKIHKTTKNYPARDVNRAEVEKLSSRT